MSIRLISILALAATSLGAEIPRTPDGRPDLSGTYDIATLTPLVRPAYLGERLALTDQEAQAVAQKTAALKASQDKASDPNRKAPPKGGDGSSGAAGNVGGYNSFWIDNGVNAFKIDGKWRTSIVTDPRNGQMPELTPEAKKRAKQRAALAGRIAAMRSGLPRESLPGPMTIPSCGLPLSVVCWPSAQAAGRRCFPFFTTT